MGTILLATNTVGRLGSGFGTTMAIGLALMATVFIFISLKDNRTALLVILVLIAALSWYFYGDMFAESFQILKGAI